MPKFRKKPVVISAIQWKGDNESLEAISLLAVNSPGGIVEHSDGIHLIIPTLEGAMTAHINDWIIQGIEGEIYPCKPDIFAKTYEVV